jgi:predicted SAM-dependent methyltransferase
MRPFKSFQKVRILIGWLKRNRASQASAPHLQSLEHLNTGCGPQVTADYVNLDYRWVPGVDVVWDSLRTLPFPDDRFRGIFTEHCLEHFTLMELDQVLHDFQRVLKIGGCLRIVVPSLELHARYYAAAQAGQLENLPDAYKNEATPARVLNGIFYCGHDNMSRSRWNNDGHHYIHDYRSMEAFLRNAGFAEVRQVSYGHGRDPHLLIDREDRAWESLYVEAVK